jgi:2-dehydropantoate 2-reductase
MSAAEIADTLSIVGAGSLGQSFAGLLALSGQAVTLLGTAWSAERLLAGGRIHLRGVVEQDVAVAPAPAAAGVVGVTADPSRLPWATGLIFATKGHDLPTAVDAVRAVWPAADDRASWVAGIQNGIVKDDVLAAAFGSERVVGGVTILGAQREPDGGVRVAARGMTYLGELPGGMSPRVEAAVELLRRAEIPIEAAADIRSVIWSKECNAVGVFGVTVLARVSSPGMGRSPHLVRAYLSLIREVGAVADAYGVRIGDYAGFSIRTYLDLSDDEVLALFASRARPAEPGAVESYSSMAQDLLAGRPMEVDQIFADLVERAQKVGIPVPRITLVRDLIRGIDPGHRVM